MKPCSTHASAAFTRPGARCTMSLSEPETKQVRSSALKAGVRALRAGCTRGSCEWGSGCGRRYGTDWGSSSSLQAVDLRPRPLPADRTALAERAGALAKRAEGALAKQAKKGGLTLWYAAGGFWHCTPSNEGLRQVQSKMVCRVAGTKEQVLCSLASHAAHDPDLQNSNRVANRMQ